MTKTGGIVHEAGAGSDAGLKGTDAPIVSSTMSRRSFAIGAMAGAVATGTCGALDAQRRGTAFAADASLAVGVPETWDYGADVVIVGAGAAGYMAACAAHEQGASSLLLDKGATTGGDSLVSGCITIGPWPERTLADSGMQDTQELWLQDQLNSHPYSHRGMAGEDVSDDLSFVRRQGELMPDTYVWMQDVAGVQWVNYYYVNNAWTPQPGWDTVFPRDWTASNGVIPPLQGLAESYDDVKTMTETQVTDIIQDAAGRAIGVWALTGDGNLVSAKARRAVIISTGTFNSNRFLVNKYLGYQVAALSVAAQCNSTGDGLLLAQEAGGATRDLGPGTHWSPQTLANTSTFTASLAYYGAAPVYPSSLPGILVNADGRRYCSESLGYSLIGKHTSEQRFHIGWYVVDAAGAANLIPEDPSNELFAQADTLEELAARMPVDPTALAEEVATYNAGIDAGQDAAFGKYINGCQRIETAPFYAMPLMPLPYTTYGGIAVDVDGHVLTPEGDPIPSLYAAGMCTGSFAEQAGLFYLGGIAQSLAFGRQAGTNAAAEQAWE